MLSVQAQTVPVEHAWEVDDTLLGPGKIRDLMALRSESDWILPLDDNDLLDPDHVETGLTHSRNADVVYSWCRVEGPTWIPNRLFNPKALLRANYIPVTALIRKHLLDEVGGFQYNNHWSLWLRALKAGAKFKCVPEVTWTIRLTDDLEYACIQKGAAQKPLELQRLIAFLRQRPLRRILEIGTWTGATLWLWCQLAEPDARLISVDLPGGDGGGGYAPEDIPKLLTLTKHQQSLNLLREDSHNPRTLTKVERLLDGEKLDLLFIDGDHTYEGVKQDFEMYSGLVRPGGSIVFHDIIEHTREIVQVDKFWNEIKLGYDYKEFIDQSDKYMDNQWGGIGVIIASE